MNRFARKLFLFVSVLSAVWTAFFIGTEANAQESRPIPPRFGKVLVLFSAETPKEDRDAFLDGLEEARFRHQQDYRELVRKSAEFSSEHGFYHNPWFLEAVDVQMIRQLYNMTSNRPWEWEQLSPLLRRQNWRGAEALIVVASDRISSALNGFARNGNHENEPEQDDMVVLFAGVSEFDESVREPQTKGDKTEPAIFPNAFAIRHPVDPWPNTELALSVFPKTKKVVLLTSGKVWSEEKETAYRAKLGPGKTLKTIPIPEIPERDVTEADIKEIKDKFAASLKAEIQPDTVIVSLSSIEHGQDPVEWLPDDFDACPVFSDTPPVRKNEVGGFCRSMNKLALQAADLLEDLSKDSLYLTRKSVPATIAESDDLWLNEASLKRYKLNLADFPDNVIVANTTTKEAPQRRVYPTWTKKRIFALLAANALVLGGLAMLTLLSIRARRRRRTLSEKVYDSLPARVLVTDREGRIIDYHMQFGELEQQGELLWKNINEVPWLRDAGIDKAVREAFDSGKTIVREFEIDGERRTVVLTSTPSDVFGRAAVVAVSSDIPQHA